MKHLAKLIGLSALIFVGLSLGASDVGAAPFVIDGGSASVMNFLGGPFDLIGDDVELTGGMNFGPMVNNPLHAGETVKVHVGNVGLDLRSGPGVVNGVFYAKLFYEGELQFDSSFVVPNISSPSMFVLDTPFTLGGILRACLNPEIDSPCLPGNLVFPTSSLVGQGTAHVSMFGFDSPQFGREFSLQSVAYEFAPAVVPEPSTLLLAGTCLVLLARRYRNRRR